MFGIIALLFAHSLEAKAIKGFSVGIFVLQCSRTSITERRQVKERTYWISMYTMSRYRHVVPRRNRCAIRKCKVLYHFAKHVNWKFLLDAINNCIRKTYMHQLALAASTL